MGFYGLFRNKVQSLISDLESATTHVLGLLALNFNDRKRSAAEKTFNVDDEF
jgi:hypothetical protein